MAAGDVVQGCPFGAVSVQLQSQVHVGYIVHATHTYRLPGVVMREAVLPEPVDHLVELVLADVSVVNKPLPPQVSRHCVINTLCT